MKILFVTNHLGGTDGWSRYSLDIMTELVRQKHEVRAAVWRPVPNVSMSQEAVLENPLKYISNPFLVRSSASRLKKVVREFNPDVLHFCVEPYGAMLPHLSVGNIRTVITLHGTYAYFPALVRGWRRVLAQRLFFRMSDKVDAIVAISNFTKKYFLQAFPESARAAGKLHVIPNGIDLAEIPPPLVKKKLDKEPYSFLFVGAVKRRKGLLEALEVLANFRDKFPSNFHYQIIGGYNQTDAYVQELKIRSKELSLEKSVIFRGRVPEEELDAAYRRADVLLEMPINNGTEFEGFGLVYLEAAARGLPAVGSLGSGAEEAVAEGVSGYLVDPHRLDEVSERLYDIVVKKTIKAIKCRQWAENHALDKLITKLLEIYEKSASGDS